MTLAQHSASNPSWGTPPLIRHFCATVLREASRSGREIDLDYASEAYWHQHWPSGTRPAAYLDGSEGRDVLNGADRRRAVKSSICGSGFLNPPGLDGGRMIQRCWEIFEADHRVEWLDSGAWIGFSIEQFASLIRVGQRNPLSNSVVTIVPSRRIPYVLHPKDLIALILKKQAKRPKKSDKWKVEQRQIEKLLARENDDPVAGPAPTHASYISFLLSHSKVIRRRQVDAMHTFLETQKKDDKSRLQHVEIIGRIHVE